MNAREWKHGLLDLIDGVEQHVCASAPKSATTRLRQFRVLLPRARTPAARRLYERKLETFLQSAPYLRRAARRHLTPKAAAALKRSGKALEQADRLLKLSKERRAQAQ